LRIFFHGIRAIARKVQSKADPDIQSFGRVPPPHQAEGCKRPPPGFRRDERVLEKILSRYIWSLTIVGGAAIGLLAALADLTGALSQGTGILLAVMIIYKLYEEIAKQHMMDMHPAMRKFME